MYAKKEHEKNIYYGKHGCHTFSTGHQVHFASGSGYIVSKAFVESYILPFTVYELVAKIEAYLETHRIENPFEKPIFFYDDICMGIVIDAMRDQVVYFSDMPRKDIFNQETLFGFLNGLNADPETQKMYFHLRLKQPVFEFTSFGILLKNNQV